MGVRMLLIGENMMLVNVSYYLTPFTKALKPNLYPF